VTTNPHGPGRCRDLAAQICSYLDGDLSPANVAALERHLADCVCCTAFADSLRRAVLACRAAGQSTLPPAVRRRAKDRIAAVMGTPGRARRASKPRG
jgi:anti-sigma factor RsiW